MPGMWGQLGPSWQVDAIIELATFGEYTVCITNAPYLIRTLYFNNVVLIGLPFGF